MIVQMTINGSMTSASNVVVGEDKLKAYEKIFTELKLETTKGSKFKLKELKQELVILNFWASWCRPCVSEFKGLNKLIDKFPKEKLLVIGINNDDENPEKAIKKTEEEYKLKFESIKDTDSDLAGKFRINSIPASIVYYKGKVIHYVNKEFDFNNPDFLDLLKTKLDQ